MIKECSPNLKHFINGWMCPFGIGLTRVNYLNISEKLIDIFSTFELTNEDYKDCINKHKDKSRCLFVFDPPYFCTEKTYKENYINVNEYINLIKTIVKECNNFVFVTYSSEFVNYIISHECGDSIDVDYYNVS